MAAYSFHKRERLCSMKLTDRLFNGAGRLSMVTFPIRIVWMEKEREAQEPSVQIMVSVSKRHFKHAVKRNRVKRQLREAYRLTKRPLVEKIEKTPQRTLLIAFIWLADELYSSATVTNRMEQLLLRLMDKL